MGWNKAPEAEGNGLYVKLKDGSAVKGVISGEKREFYVVWQNGKPLPAQEGEPGAKFRFRVNLAMKEAGKWVPKILEGGAMINDAIFDVVDAGYNLNETVVKLSRTGSGALDTEYKLVATPEKLSEDDVKQLGLLNLNDLTK